MDEVFSWFSSLWDSLVQQLLGLLPLSPFTGVIESLSGYPYLDFQPTHDNRVEQIQGIGSQPQAEDAQTRPNRKNPIDKVIGD